MAGLNEGSNKSDVTSRLVALIGKMSNEERQGLLHEIETRPFLRKRRHRRKPYFSVVDYSAQEYPFADFIRNIAAEGIFISTSTPFSFGQEVLLAFPLPVSQEHITIPGEIVRIEEEGIGVKFKTFDQELKRKIKKAVDMIV
jgi:Tfp pilus assembly protein PilZ